MEKNKKLNSLQASWVSFILSLIIVSMTVCIPYYLQYFIHSNLDKVWDISSKANYVLCCLTMFLIISMCQHEFLTIAEVVCIFVSMMLLQNGCETTQTLMITPECVSKLEYVIMTFICLITVDVFKYYRRYKKQSCK